MSPTKGEAKLLLVLDLNAVHGFHGDKNNLLTKNAFVELPSLKRPCMPFHQTAIIKSTNKQSLSI